MLRTYQQQAHDQAIDWVRQCVEPCLIEAATGAGKSHIIAAIAETMYRISKGKHILCIAPSAELVLQNREKYIATGNKASIFSASAGAKELRHPVVFGTPITIKNKIHRFGDKFCAVVVDEAHGMTPTVQHIIKKMQEHNPNLRVIGLTATPYTMRGGYIYALDNEGKPMGEHCSKDPYFAKLVYQIGAPYLIQQGFLTPPVIGAIGTQGYDTINMQLNSQGKFNAADVDRAYHGKGRKTSAVIADIVAQSRDRKGVLIFAATVQHAHECMESLPPELSAIVHSETHKDDRKRILRDFKAQKIKYLVNVAVLTTGFDAPHVDVVALLRATESVGLLQQIIGRGLRLASGKIDCLLLDYAENIERHCPDGDLFKPEVRVSMKGATESVIKAKCPSCSVENTFAGRPNPDQFNYDAHGYFVDLAGNRISSDEGHPVPAHLGRRCQALHPAPGGQLIQCEYRWTFKECDNCFTDNDIAARYCRCCKAELVDPNEKLRIEFKAMKKDPTNIQCDSVLSLVYGPTVARSGRECIKATFVTAHRSFTVWYSEAMQRPLRIFQAATSGGAKPATVTYRKNPKTGFYETLAFNQQEDRPDEVPRMVASVRGSELQGAMPA
jgi:DNA repair protein RadD